MLQILQQCSINFTAKRKCRRLALKETEAIESLQSAMNYCDTFNESLSNSGLKGMVHFMYLLAMPNVYLIFSCQIIFASSFKKWDILLFTQLARSSQQASLLDFVDLYLLACIHYSEGEGVRKGCIFYARVYVCIFNY